MDIARVVGGEVNPPPVLVKGASSVEAHAVRSPPNDTQRLLDRKIFPEDIFSPENTLHNIGIEVIPSPKQSCNSAGSGLVFE
jgi:hypothetical protein